MAEEHEPEIELSPRLEELSAEYSKDPTSRKFLPLAEEYRKSRMYDEAIYICKEGLKHHPDFVQALLTLARCQVETKDFDAAKVTLKEILDKNVDNPSANKMLGELHMRRGEFVIAREHFQKAQAARPGDIEIEGYLRQMGQSGNVKPESVEISTDGELHIDKEELMRRSAYDWVEQEKKEGDEQFGLPEEEQKLAAGPRPKPIELYGTKSEEGLDLDLAEGDMEPDLELSLEGEGESLPRRESLEEEEPVKTLDLKRVEEMESVDETGAGPDVGEIEEIAGSESEVGETESLIAARGEERIIETEIESRESQGIAEEEGIETGGEAASESGETVERSREEFFEIDTESLPPSDLTGVTEETEAARIGFEEVEREGEAREGLETAIDEEEPAETVAHAAEHEAFVPEEEAAEETIEEIPVAGSLEIGDEDQYVEIDVLELDVLGEDEFAAFPAEELELERIHIVRDGSSPEGVEVGTLEERLIEDARKDYEAEEEMAFELGNDFVLEGVEADLAIGDLAPSPVELEEAPSPADAAEVEIVAERKVTAEEAEEQVAPLTVTAARIYEEQGHLEEALGIYRKLLADQPDEAVLSQKVEEIRMRLSGERVITASRDKTVKIEILSLWLSNLEAFNRRISAAIKPD
jgi:tetratricopeptide (TPR) repeat protein